MGTSNYSDEFKRDAVQQITVRGYPVREVSRRLRVSSHSLYKWLRLFAEPAPKLGSIDHEAENRRLRRALARVTEERDILRKQRRASRASPSELRLYLTREAARQDVFDYIEMFYNPKRKQTNNGMQSPVDFETQ
jgi:transposase